MTDELTTPEITGVASPGDGEGTGMGTTSPGYALPFLFAWVNSDQTTFDETMLRNDEEILEINLQHEEGQVPTLSVTIKNPYTGLLNATRHQWAWLAYQPPNLDPYAEGTFSGPGDFTNIPNGYGSSGATDLAPETVEGTPEYVVDGYVQPGYQVYDDATIILVPPIPSSSNLGTSPSPSGGASGPPPYTNGNTVVPIFFGELIGVPDDLFAEKITLKFLARSENYIQWKQACAETLKIPGNYDPVFLKEKEQDNPDSILEGWSSLYHVDRCSLEVTASDVLVGEDGTVVFAESPPSAIYDSVKVKIGQAPLTNVQVQTTVHWMQRTTGYVDGPDVSVASYTGGSFADDWPKPGKGLGAGWTVETSYVDDPYTIKETPMWNITTDIQFYGTLTDYDCATVSINESSSQPALLGPVWTAGGGIPTVITTGQSSFCDPYSIPPTNIPAKLVEKLLYVPLWGLNCSWELKYEAKREFTEVIFVDVTANTQAILTSPTVEQDTALIKMNGEVGEPLLIYDAWSDFAGGKHFGKGQLIYPNNPLTPGGLAYQISLGGGTGGNVEPDFSDVPGAVTAEISPGTGSWVSLGENPQAKIQKMAFATNYDVGTILLYADTVFNGGPGSLEDVVPPSTSYWICTAEAGTTGAALSDSAGAVPNVGEGGEGEFTVVQYRPLPTESDQLLFPPALTIAGVPYFDPNSDAVLTSINCTDFTIISGGAAGVAGMAVLGSVPGIPVGGTADNVTARCYFPTARGKESIEYAINRARAKIRMRSRALEVSWACPIEMVLGMSCRMNATLYEPRLPGGVATGKVIKYGMTASKGKIRGSVTIGCSVGYNAFGSPNADISYTGAVFEPFDDGLQFPLGDLPSDGGFFTETLPTQYAALEPGILAELISMKILNPPQPITPVQSGVGGETIVTTGVGPATVWTAAVDAAILPNLMKSNPIGWICEIDSVVNGPFLGAYTITVSPLELPQGVNLSAPGDND